MFLIVVLMLSVIIYIGLHFQKKENATLLAAKGIYDKALADLGSEPSNQEKHVNALKLGRHFYGLRIVSSEAIELKVQSDIQARLKKGVN